MDSFKRIRFITCKAQRLSSTYSDGYPEEQINGEIISIGWRIIQEDVSIGSSLLMNVKSTFECILLAMRF